MYGVKADFEVLKNNRCYVTVNIYINNKFYVFSTLSKEPEMSKTPYRS